MVRASINTRVGQARLSALFGVLVGSALTVGCRPLPPGPTLFAAASTEAAVTEIVRRFREHTGVEVLVNAAGSATLARQIEQGAPADLFLSANGAWMDHLVRRGLVDDARRRDLLETALVLIVPEESELDGIGTETFPGGLDPGRLAEPCLALGQTDAVPVGIYARQAFERIGWWPRLSGRIVETADVRAVLALIARRECGAGVVYAADLTKAKFVRVLARIPDSLHERVRFPIAPVGDPVARNEARVRDTEGLLEFLTGEEAAEIFRAHGFEVVGRPRPSALVEERIS